MSWTITLRSMTHGWVADSDSAASQCKEEDANAKADDAHRADDQLTGTLGEQTLAGGLLCAHGLVCRPRAGFLAQRADVVQLLACALEKEQAYAKLWPDARALPRLRTGHPDGHILSFDDVCPDCRGPQDAALGPASAGANGGSDAAVEGLDTPMQRELTVRQRFSSKQVRRKGTLMVPMPPQGVTGRALCALVKEKLNLPVLKLAAMVRCGGSAPVEREIGSDDLLPTSVEVVIVEKDENATPAEREGAAFEGSVFRAASA